MRAICLKESLIEKALEEQNLPEPRPGSRELLIRVYAAGVTSDELNWYPTLHRRDGEKRVGAVPAHEFSGVIAGFGEDAAGFSPGQEVYGMNDWFADGALAEYCLTEPSLIAPKPSRLTHEQAASVPISALTAWQGLFDRAKLKAGERVLIHGGAGSVGICAVQLARNRGAHVIATASTQNLNFVRLLGANEVIDYRSEPFELRAQAIDVVFDTVGGETLERSWGLLRPGGRVVTIATAEEASTDSRVKEAFFIVSPSRDQLLEIGKLVEGGKLQPVVGGVVPFSQAAAAYVRPIANRHSPGKLVVAVAEETQPDLSP